MTESFGGYGKWQALSAEDIVDAWNSVTDLWFYRRNKDRSDGKQYEVIHDWGDGEVSDETRKIMAHSFANHKDAHEYAQNCLSFARAEAVLKMLYQIQKLAARKGRDGVTGGTFGSTPAS